MTFTIQQVLRPLLVARFFIGLGVYPTKQSKLKIQWIKYLSTAYTLTIWIVHGCLFYYVLSLFTINVLFRSTTHKIIVVINILTTIISVIMSLYYQKNFETCMNKLALVNDTLEKLGTPKMYQKMHVWSKWMVIGWIVYSLVLNCYDTIWWINQKETASWGLYLSHIFNYNIHINAFVDLLFIFFLWYVGTRFEKVNEHMQCLLINKDHEIRCTWKKPVITFHRYTSYIDNYKQILWISIHLHLEICRIAREINLMFGTQMTFEIISYLFFVTILCFKSYFFVTRGIGEEILLSITYGFRRGLWIVVILMRLYIINYMCENVKLKANKIDIVIHHLTNTLRYADVWKEVHQFILQGIHRPLKFTGMGLFYFGNVFLQKFCTTMVTFMIILVQMVKFPD
ncbi:putative gustatory receptor 28b [Linepithema humile]|uniref:putative gustatory receptor 28b n=1 Tax=Linepithema humile TaxID=83485 RepID=UPI00351E4CE7